MTAVTDFDIEVAVLGMALIGKCQLQGKTAFEFIGQGYGQCLLLTACGNVSAVIQSEPVLYHPVDYGTGQAAAYPEVYGIAYYGIGVGVERPQELGVGDKGIVIPAGYHHKVFIPGTAGRCGLYQIQA